MPDDIILDAEEYKRHINASQTGDQENIEEAPVQPESNEEQSEQSEIKETPVVLTEAERNFNSLRREKRRMANELEDTKRRLAEYEAVHNENEQEEEEDIDIGDDDITEGKHLKKVLKKQKKLEAELRELRQKSAEDTVENRIRNKYADYDAVVNTDTLAALAEEDPELIYTIQSSPDVYNKAILAYKEIKRRGIITDKNYDSDKKRAQTNATKPRPVVSASPSKGQSPLSHANAFAEELTPELKSKLWKEMQSISKTF